MAWIKLDHTTADKPEVMQMADALSMTPEQIMGHILRVWVWADQQSLNGHAINVTEKGLDRVARHEGFVTAMRKVGWIHGQDGAISFPNFYRHNGETAKTRALASKRKVTQRSRNERDNSVTREDKRRVITPIPPSGAFLKFWAIWPRGPRKKSQGKCWELWLKKDFDQTATAICAHVELLKQTPDWQKGFVCAPMVYLNQRQWEGADLVLEAEKVSPLYRREGVM